MIRDIKKIINEMTLEEKASLCSGLDSWHTKDVKRLRIPSILMADGPHGLRKQAKETDHSEGKPSIPATCFPSGATLACSWDRKLIEKVGIALGEECQAESVSIILGPSANIKRSPLCGRNFEYFSEDPYLSSQMAEYHIKGVQSQGIGTSLKHFAANNQEHRRMSVDTIINERTLREIYLASFEKVVKQTQPWTVMCAYNKINGEYCSENKYLLTDILKDEWGHKGFVMSDWGAVNERVKGLSAGLELEMPSSWGIGDKKIIKAIESGQLEEKVLNKAVERLLTVIFKAENNKKEDVSYNKDEHHQLARKVAGECMVLLKNEDHILPFKKNGAIALIGGFAKISRYQGGGSSHINPTKIENAYDEMLKIAGNNVRIRYAQGYLIDSDEIDESLISEAKETAKNTDMAVVFVGLPDRYESEGYDRNHMNIPENHKNLIEAVAEVQKNIVVVLSNGAPIEMPWAGKAKSIVEGYLGGQAVGGAIADVLFGITNPCGKLAETFPMKLSHNPSYINFPGEDDKVEYKEGLFVGYRYYDTKGIEPLFPFGYGLSYTKFEYTDISADKNKIKDTDTVTIKVKVKNTGSIVGKEIIQLYIRDIESSVIRPFKELKGFEKVELQPGEEKEVSFILDKRSFAYYNVDIKDWHVESGDFEILIGKSSKEIVLRKTINIQSTVNLIKKFHRNSTVGDLMNNPNGKMIIEKTIQQFKQQDGMSFDLSQMENSEMGKALLRYMPLRGLITFSNGIFSEEMLENLIVELNNSEKQMFNKKEKAKMEKDKETVESSKAQDELKELDNLEDTLEAEDLKKLD